MPFKLLKKSRHYSVVSKSLFVISVELLDGTNIECTLSSESTGQDCLDVVCQKLSLNQPKFFGLQYISSNRDGTLCWLELDRPTKRQLDKHARGLSVFLRVMYYVKSGVRLFNDEVTRNHYFLQLKMDIIDGRISCTPQQAIELASFCMQAEFGNFDAERHTAHYLKDFQLFPKCFTDPTFLESLTDRASAQHAILHNIPQGTAEEYYICACQRLDGYGQEIYNVKDKGGDDAIVGVSLTGVTVTYPSGREGRSYGWVDISNVINHKRDFTIESVVGSDKAEFHFGDVESAKNAWRFCVLQHMFFRQYEMGNNTEQPESTKPNFQATLDNKLRQIDSYEDITSYGEPFNNLTQRAQSTSCLDLNTPTDIDKLRSLLPSYRPAPDYETAVQSKYRNSAGGLQTQQPLRNTHAILYSSQPEIHQTDAYATHLRYPDVTHNNVEQKNIVGYAGYTKSQVIPTENHMVDLGENMRMLHLIKPPPPYPANRISSNSTPDLAGMSQMAKPQNQFINSIVSGSSPDLVSSFNNHYLKQYGQAQVYNAHPVHRSHSYLPPQHGTYENLPSFFNNNMLGRPQAVIVENPNITKHIKKVYDEHGNIIYCMPANMKQILEDNQLPSTGFVVTRNQNAIVAHSPDLNNSPEPIYENIPLPWANENNQMRSRTQSIQSAPEVSQVINHTVVNAHIIGNNVQQFPNTSKENLYANIDRNAALNVTKTDAKNASNLNLTESRSTQNLDQLNTTPTLNSHLNSTINSQLNTSINSQITPQLNSTQNSQLNTSNSIPARSESPSTMSRTNTFIINKNSSLNSSGTSHAYTDPGNVMNKNSSLNSSGTSHAYTDPGNVSTETFATDSSSNTTVGSKKKKRWGILMGRSKSSEKIKSATLGREKEKKDKNQSNNRHRWSTGLPRLHPLPPSISKETMCQLLENKLADSQLFFEFDKIPKKKQNADFTTASLPENAMFNRFKDVLPYEDNRLRLTPSRDNKYGYINASHITATVGSKQRFYIAAQGPTRITLPSFWQCVWEAEVYLLIQLMDTTEDLNYLPDSGERCIDVGQDYQVWWEFSQKTGHCITSKIRLCHVASRRYRTLWHLHYTDWGEQGCPQSVAHFLGFLEELQSVQQHSMAEIPPGHNKNPPVFVHCTAGVGRTGLTVLADLLLYTVDHNQEVDIPRVVGLLRHQRAFMVQTIAQYRFVYSLLIHYLKQTRLI